MVSAVSSAGASSGSASSSSLSALQRQLAALQRQLQNAQKSACGKQGQGETQIIAQQISGVEAQIAAAQIQSTSKAAPAPKVADPNLGNNVDTYA
jgi:hypothetical protein